LRHRPGVESPLSDDDVGVAEELSQLTSPIAPRPDDRNAFKPTASAAFGTSNVTVKRFPSSLAKW